MAQAVKRDVESDAVQVSQASDGTSSPVYAPSCSSADGGRMTALERGDAFSMLCHNRGVTSSERATENLTLVAVLKVTLQHAKRRSVVM